MTTYSYHTCPICGIHYAADQVVMDYKRALPSSDKGRGWYCPNGHSLIFTESEADKYRREAERLRQQTARLEEVIADRDKRLERADKEAKRLKRRASMGICSCCNRTFQNVARHMATKHPNVVPIDVKKVASN